MRWVLSLRNSVSLVFSIGLVSCLAITFRLCQEALHLRSSCTRLLASSSKSTWKSEMSVPGHAGTAGQPQDPHPLLAWVHLPCLTLAERVMEAISE